MNTTEYLEKSARTTAPTANEDMNISISDVYALTDVIESGIDADKQKRIIFYKSNPENAQARAESSFKLLENTVDGKLDKAMSISVDQKTMDLYHAILGIQSEVGELAEQLLFSILENKQIDDVNVKEECGDTSWYLALALRAVSGSFDDTFERNIAKLAKRYPEKFSTNLAENRDLDAERKVLE